MRETNRQRKGPAVHSTAGPVLWNSTGRRLINKSVRAESRSSSAASAAKSATAAKSTAAKSAAATSERA
jgi:hypothetical protein